VNANAPPSVWLPPRALQYRSAREQKRGSSRERLSSAASIACFSEAARPIDEDLGSKHAGVGHAEEAARAGSGVRLGDEEEPRPIGRSVDVDGPQHPVDALLAGREQGEVALGGRRQRLDHVLGRIAVDAVEEVVREDRDLGVGQEERVDAALGEGAAHRGVVGEVAVVDQRLVHPDERMSAAGMPHPPLGRIAVVADPDVGAEPLEPVGPEDVVAVPHHLDDEEVLAV